MDADFATAAAATAAAIFFGEKVKMLELGRGVYL